MKTITRAKLPNGEILTWTSLLKKYKIHHSESKSAHVEWDNEVKLNKKLPKVKVVYLDNISNNDNCSDKDNNKRNIKRNIIPKNIRETVWQIYNQNSLTGKCYVCERPIMHDNFDVAHDKAVSNGGKDNISNLRPICKQCNSSMGTMSIEKFKEKWFSKNTIEETNSDERKNNIRLLKELKNKIGHNDYKNALTAAINNLKIDTE